MTRDTNNQKTAHILTGMCGLLFALFTFCYLYVMQADQLAAVQHVLSKGQTVYHPLRGALLVTAVLCGVAWFCSRLRCLPLRAVALYLFPAALGLGLLTSLVPVGAGRVASQSSPVVVAVLLVLYVAVVLYMMRRAPRAGGETLGIVPLLMPNLLWLLLQMGVVGVLGSCNDVYHYRLEVARLVGQHQDSAALQVGATSLHTDRSLTAMRAFAMSRSGSLPQRLFDYPQPYGSEGLMPLPSDTLYPQRWTDSLYVHLGGRPSTGIRSTRQFLNILSGRVTACDPVCDYLLCACLLDKDLDAFVEALPRYYALNDSLPMCYQEALVLYGRLHTHPRLMYTTEVVQANLDAFMQLEDSYADPLERCNRTREQYGHTYWWYYRHQQLPE